jgi:glycosyltransferase involved in cell wall biosynthesis
VQLIALVKHLEDPSCRYRVEGLRSRLERAGHELSVEVLPRRGIERILLSRRLRAADTVILQRRLLPLWLVWLVRRHARRLVFDFDDAIYRHDSFTGAGEPSARRMRRFRAAVAASDAVAAGNRFLAGEASRFTSADRVHVVPTCLEPSVYPIADQEGEDGVKLVWIGSRSMVRSLEDAAPLLGSLAVPGARLRVICDAFPKLDGLEVEAVPWSSSSEAAELARSHIGISHVPDDEWSRGKCGLKVLQYMAAGLPVVANPVGVQAEMVVHEVTGYLARTRDEWASAVRTLAGSPELRRRMGLAGRRLVEERWSLDAAGAAWTSILERIGEGARSP